MYIYILLLMFVSALTVEGRGVWDVIVDLILPTQNTTKVIEDAHLNITDLANKYGYELEQHTVTTEDGYIINFHRIPPNNGTGNATKVFLMHGILESSDSWLLLGPNKSLAYLLADEGYDVWMGNTRGNKHSTTHKTWHYDSADYWKFTWEEIGLYDLPAMVDYITEKSGNGSLYYIGHSQGTTSGYVMLSMKPEYNEKIKIMFSLAPEAWMGNVESPIIRLFSPAVNILGSLLLDFNSAATEFFVNISSFLCTLVPVKCDTNILSVMTGHESKIKQSLMPVIFGHMPTGASVLQFVHYGQLVVLNRFCRFDHGYATNMEKYNQTTPPDYVLSNISTANVLYYSSNDWLSHPKDVEKLISELPNVLASNHLSDFNHMDYVYAEEARDVIYMKIIEQINDFEFGNDTYGNKYIKSINSSNQNLSNIINVN